MLDDLMNLIAIILDILIWVIYAVSDRITYVFQCINNNISKVMGNSNRKTSKTRGGASKTKSASLKTDKHGNKKVSWSEVYDSEEEVKETAYLSQVYDQDNYVVGKNEQGDDKTLAEMIKNASKETAIAISKSQIYIKMSDLEDTVQVLKTVTLEDNDYTKAHIKDDVVVLESKIDIKGIHFSVSCNHLLGVLPIEMCQDFQPYNNHIVVRMNGNVKRVGLRPIVRSGDKLIWYTYNTESQKYMYVETEVTKPIVAYINDNGRRKLATVAIMVNIPKDENLVASGSLMTVNKFPFIGLYVIQSDNAKIDKIVAVALADHDYTIIVVP